jgi:RNA polymerase sigma-70 factor (ECF subfamily)
MAAESVKVLDSALESLPRGCRQVFALRHVHGLSLDEIALKLGISRSGVEKQVSRALRLLRERMINRSE